MSLTETNELAVVVPTSLPIKRSAAISSLAGSNDVKRARLCDREEEKDSPVAEEIVLSDGEGEQADTSQQSSQHEDLENNSLLLLGQSDSDGSAKKTKSTRPRRRSSAVQHSLTIEQERRRKEREERLEQIRLDKEQKAQQKLQEKLERERIIEQKKAEKERLAKEKEDQRKAKEEEKRLAEEKRKAEEEAKREKKRLEEEAKKEKRRLEEEAKRDKRRAEEEAREAKRKADEERREQKLREEHEKEAKTLKQKEKFRSFFVKEKRPSDVSTRVVLPVNGGGRWKPLQLKEGMTLAPILPRLPLSGVEHDQFLHWHQNHPAKPYLETIKQRKLVAARKVALRAKLLQFHTNYRPPYYGTWRKASRQVTGRKPLAKDKSLEYDVDSDEEWEEEPEDADECLSGADEDDKMTSKLRQHSVSSVRKLQELVHECNVTLATYRTSLQNLGTIADSPQLRREVETNGRACMRAAEAAKTSVMPQLRHEGVEFTRHASQFIACLSAMLVELKRCEALLATFPLGDAPLGGDIAAGEAMLEALENLITVHFSTSECSPADKVTPRRRRGNPCRPGCCSRLKTSYA